MEISCFDYSGGLPKLGLYVMWSKSYFCFKSSICHSRLYIAYSVLILFFLNIAGIPRMSSVTIFQSDHFVLSTNFLFKFNVSLPLVTGELLQNTVDVNNVTYKLYNIKLQRLPVLLNTKNYLSTGQAIT